jgi:hypothetical protein
MKVTITGSSYLSPDNYLPLYWLLGLYSCYGATIPLIFLARRRSSEVGTPYKRAGVVDRQNLFQLKLIGTNQSPNKRANDVVLQLSGSENLRS